MDEVFEVQGLYKHTGGKWTTWMKDLTLSEAECLLKRGNSLTDGLRIVRVHSEVIKTNLPMKREQKPEQMKALCKICHDGYADENFCLGRCCGVRMVQIPDRLWKSVDRNNRQEIQQAIEIHGEPLR